MKNRVIITKENEEIKFYLKNKEGTFWLFSQPFSKGVYEQFKDGRAEGEVLSFSKWNRNKRLNDTINRIPREIRYVQKYVMEVDRVA